jgi:hypothetical protein
MNTFPTRNNVNKGHWIASPNLVDTLNIYQIINHIEVLLFLIQFLVTICNIYIFMIFFSVPKISIKIVLNIIV